MVVLRNEKSRTFEPLSHFRSQFILNPAGYFLGGPGAVFRMWIIALLGMATICSEVLLALSPVIFHLTRVHFSGQTPA